MLRLFRWYDIRPFKLYDIRPFRLYDKSIRNKNSLAQILYIIKNRANDK